MKFHVEARFVPGKDRAPEYDAEVRRVRELRDEGVIEMVLRRLDDSGAYLVLVARDRQHADSIVATLPFAQTNVMRFTLEPIEQL